MKRDEDSQRVTTRYGYAHWADLYDDHDDPMTAMVEHLLALAPADLAGASVLELGCGTGRNARALQSMGAASYLGIDNSPEMLAAAQARPANMATPASSNVTCAATGGRRWEPSTPRW